MTQHEPKEPRPAPTREEFIATLNRFRDLESDGDVILNNAIVEVDLIKAFDALAAERDEWKRRADSFSESYDNIDHRCNVETARADKAEAERDAALAALRAQGEIRLDIRHASDLKLRVGILLQLHWKNLTDEQFKAIKAICDEALGEK